MTSSDDIEERAAGIVRQLVAGMDENELVRRIDRPIDQAAGKLIAQAPPEYSHKQLHAAITSFVQQLLLAGADREGMPRAHAHDEAIAIIEQGYEGAHAKGYEGAVLDAMDPSHPGLALVLARIAEAVKARHRQLRVTGLAAKLINPNDWELKCAIAGLLLERCRPWLTPELQACATEQLADDVVDLLALHLATDTGVQQLKASPF